MKQVARKQVVVGQYLARNALNNALRVVPFFARASIRGLIEGNIAVLSGSAALKALTGDSWKANDLDLFGQLDAPTVKALEKVLEEIKGVNLAKSIVISSSLDRRPGSFAEGWGPRNHGPELVREPALFRQLTRKAWGMHMEPRVLDTYYTKVRT